MKKDIEEAMKNLKPRRALKSNFAEQTLMLATKPRKPRLSFSMLRHAPGLAVMAILILLSGTVYAAFNWSEITAKFGGKTELPSGNRIIGVDTTNCNYFQVHDKPVKSNEKVYYEVSKDSSLTDDQVVSMVQGICEENAVNDIMNEVIRPYIKNGQNDVMTGSDFILDSFDKNSISVTGTTAQTPYKVTYKLGEDAKVYDARQEISLSDLKSGDNLNLLVKDSRQPSGTAGPSSANPWTSDSSLITVMAVVRTPKITGSPMTFYTHLGSDFVRTEPCNSNPTGFCRAYEFNQSLPKQ